MSVTVKPPSRELPLSLWAANPPGSNRALMVELEVIDEDTAVLGWDSRTYPFRGRFEQQLIPRMEENLRILPEEMRDMSFEANRLRIYDIFGKHVLRDLVCCVHITGEPLSDTGGVAQLVEELKTMPQLFWDAF